MNMDQWKDVGSKIDLVYTKPKPSEDTVYVIGIAESKTLNLNRFSEVTLPFPYIYNNMYFDTYEEAYKVLYELSEKYRKVEDTASCKIQVCGNEYYGLDRNFTVTSRTENHFIQVYYAIFEINKKGTNIHDEFFEYLIGLR